MFKNSKIVIAIVAIIVVVAGGLGILAIKSRKTTNKARSYDEIVNDVLKEEKSKNDNSKKSKSNLDIKVLGKSVNLPFDFDYLTKNGYTFVDKEEEQKVYSSENKKIPLVVMTNDNEKQETMYGSPYLNFDLYCGKGSANSLKNVTVVGVNILTVEKKYLSLNGFGWHDSMEDIINSLGSDYSELVGTYDQNIKTGDYTVRYSYSDLTIDIYSSKGLIDKISIYCTDNQENN